MGGFDVARAHELLGVPADEYEVIAAVAVGRHGDPTQLPEDLAARETPGARRPLAEIARQGHFRPTT
jgi:hypothetical protein